MWRVEDILKHDELSVVANCRSLRFVAALLFNFNLKKKNDLMTAFSSKKNDIYNCI